MYCDRKLGTLSSDLNLFFCIGSIFAVLVYSDIWRSSQVGSGKHPENIDLKSAHPTHCGHVMLCFLFMFLF